MRRFDTLDGLRGLAALFVVWLHGCQFFHSDLRPAHAYLAVDFFFCLSGFVISHAYDRKIGEGMSFRDFSVKRFIRLYPMIAIGVLLGGLALAAGAVVFQKMSLADCLFYTLSALLLLPAGLLKHLQAYPVNNPIWSLFFELVANIGYAIERRRVRLGAWFFSAFILLSLAVLAVLAFRRGGIEGFGFNSVASFVCGFARVTFPFFAGVALHRFGIYERFPKLNPLWAFAGLALVLALPVHDFRPQYDMVSVAVAVPVIVCLAANSREIGYATASSQYLGELSYPLYLIHQPIIQLAAMAYVQSGPQPVGAEGAIVVVMLACIGLSFAASRLLDQPVRAWLGKAYANRRSHA